MWKSNPKQYLLERQSRYKSDLTNDILPFWLEYGLDKVNGGVYTCVDRSGKLMDSTKSDCLSGYRLVTTSARS